MNGLDAPAIRTAGLGKRYGSLWALQDCSVSVPRGRVSALVGPNGAGKTTLLKILAGLSAPSAGEAAVLGRAPGQSAEFLDSLGYLAQDVPLYKRLSAGDHLEIGARLNPSWEVTEVGLEDIVVAYMGLEASSADGQLTEIGAAQ